MDLGWSSQIRNQSMSSDDKMKRPSVCIYIYIWSPSPSPRIRYWFVQGWPVNSLNLRNFQENIFTKFWIFGLLFRVSSKRDAAGKTSNPNFAKAMIWWFCFSFLQFLRCYHRFEVFLIVWMKRVVVQRQRWLGRTSRISTNLGGLTIGSMS